MIYSNGDVYEGMWSMGKRSGYGVLTKRCGDHFEGHWVNDMRVESSCYAGRTRQLLLFSEESNIRWGVGGRYSKDRRVLGGGRPHKQASRT
jgi:hypothetical protein